MLRLSLSLASSLLLAACAGQPKAPQYPPLACPVLPQAGAPQRLIVAAQGEWQRFGGTTIDWRNGERQVLQVGANERDPAMAPAIRTYWQAVPTRLGMVYANQNGRSTPTATDFDVAWSAAFVGWVACAAGVPEGQMPRDEAHFRYIDAVINGRDRPDSWFRPFEVIQTPPQPGDLVCLDRGSPTTRLSSWAERVAELGVARPLHCDLVVGVQAGQVEAIGGNVEDSVALSLYPTDPQGRLYPLGGPDNPPGWFLILRPVVPGAVVPVS
ncbi:DUF2272 domain-containing protein [Lacibacterium aquatile]|uniref:DUF2272 domain-containing protein n=1 Tax=Lacibacterium aquatile TaxID=1168082 RepID=A0ABW5DMP1_9PROT